MTPMPEPGRMAAHVYLDMVTAYDDALGDSSVNDAAMALAFQRLNEVEAVTATTDHESGELRLNISGVIGGAIVPMKWLVGRVAAHAGSSEAEVVADLRAFLDAATQD